MLLVLFNPNGIWLTSLLGPVVLCSWPTIFLFLYHVPYYVIPFILSSAYQQLLTMPLSPLQIPLQSLGQSC
jgi:hypothetical protein